LIITKVSERLKNLDNTTKAGWDKSYDLRDTTSLWGIQPVPAAERAAETFSDGNGWVLDLPCGDGRNTLPLTKNIGHVVAADSSRNALQIASKFLAANGVKNCVLVESDIFNLKFMDDQFDGIFCWDVLGHLQDVELALAELLRVCKPGGRLIGSVFALGDSTRGIDMLPLSDAEEYIYANTFYYKFYGEPEIQDLLQKVGAPVVSLELMKWDEPPHEGFREYPHEHQSWMFILEKPERTR
jgi:ubiquinone/menaquinone biosynthesis C-methylase UbiE